MNKMRIETIFGLNKFRLRKSASKVLTKGTVLVSSVAFISILMSGKAQALSIKKTVNLSDIKNKFNISQIGKKYTNPFMDTPLYVSPDIEKIRKISRFNPKLFETDRLNTNNALISSKEKHKVKMFKKQKKI